MALTTAEKSRRYRERHPERRREAQKAWREKNPELVREKGREFREKNPDYQLQKRYGISKADYDQMLVAQGGACAICRRTDMGFHVDHNHTTGRVRGILCGNCNRGIGYLRDDPQVLRDAAVYLELNRG